MFSMNVINPMISESNEANKPAETSKKLSKLDVLKKTSGAFRMDANRGLVFSAGTLVRSVFMGGIGFLVGYGVGLLLNKYVLDEEEEVNPYFTAVIGALLGYGMSSAYAVGDYKNFKASDIVSGLKNLSVKTFEMTHRMLQFNLERQYIGALIGLIRHAFGGEKLSEDNSGWAKFIKGIDNFTGLQLVQSAEEVIYDKNGKFSAFNTESVSESAKNAFSNVTSPSMLLFSAGTAIAAPLLGPAFLNSPFVGTFMQYMNMAQGFFEDKGLTNDFANTFWEEGVKEQLISLFVVLGLGETQEDLEKHKLQKLFKNYLMKLQMEILIQVLSWEQKHQH